MNCVGMTVISKMGFVSICKERCGTVNKHVELLFHKEINYGKDGGSFPSFMHACETGKVAKAQNT